MIQTAAVAALVTILTAHQTTRAGPPLADRSGTYTSGIGEISFMEGPDSLIFSYSAIAGQPGNQHTCDWTATARRQDARHFVWRDEDLDMTLTITLGPSRITMVGKDGRSMCGQGLENDVFPVATREAPVMCTVAADRAHFYTVTTDPPDERPAYVVKGDRVDVLPSQSGDSYRDFFVARFKGMSKTAMGMLRKRDLACGAKREVGDRLHPP